MSKTPEELLDLSVRVNAVMEEYLRSSEYLTRMSRSIDLRSVLGRPENEALRFETEGLVFMFDRDRRARLFNSFPEARVFVSSDGKGPYQFVPAEVPEGQPNFADLLKT